MTKHDQCTSGAHFNKSDADEAVASAPNFPSGESRDELYKRQVMNSKLNALALSVFNKEITADEAVYAACDLGYRAGVASKEPDDFPRWKKPPPREEIYDGDQFIVALVVRNQKTGKTAWEFDKLRVSCDGDEDGGFFDLIYVDNDEPYDAWTWEDFQFCIKTSGFPAEFQSHCPNDIFTALREENERLKKDLYRTEESSANTYEQLSAEKLKSQKLVELLTQASDFMKRPPAIPTGDRAWHQHDVILKIDSMVVAHNANNESGNEG